MPDSLPRLSTAEVLALAAAYYGDANALTEAVPDETWDALHERELVQTTRDFTGEGTTVTTRAGFDVLLATLKESQADV